jgi:hypothetical protein
VAHALDVLLAELDFAGRELLEGTPVAGRLVPVGLVPTRWGQDGVCCFGVTGR